MITPSFRGVIRRRILVNYRVDPAVIQAILPAPFRPQIHRGWALAGVCLIRLERLRPSRLPAVLGLSSENAAHRIAVGWRRADGGVATGVYIPRRDTSSCAVAIAGGRIFAGEHHAARFRVEDDGDVVDVRGRSRDGELAIEVRGRGASSLAATSCFASLEEAEAFFEEGCVGYSPGRGASFEGVRLVTRDFRIRPLEVRVARSSWFEDGSRFPRGSATFDSAFVMRDIEHAWQAAGSLAATPPG